MTSMANGKDIYSQSETAQMYMVANRQLKDVWPHVRQYVEQSCEPSRGEFTPQSLYESTYSGESQLWVIYDPKFTAAKALRAVVFTRLQTADSGETYAWIITCAGQHRMQWMRLVVETLSEWGRQNGAAKLKFFARKGWAKDLPDFSVTMQVMEKDLGKTVPDTEGLAHERMVRK